MTEASAKEMSERAEDWKRNCFVLDRKLLEVTKERDHYKHLSEVYHRLLVRLGEGD